MTSEGSIRPEILGPVLDGRRFALIPDTDGGAFDGDLEYDRAVGPMQFEVATHRMATELSAPIALEPLPYQVARIVDPDDAEFMNKQVSAEVLTRTDGVLLVLFSTPWRLQGFQRDNPDVVIIDLDSPSRDTLESLRSVQSSAPRPIVMFSQDDDGATIGRATRAGVSAYVVDGISGKRVRPIIDAAIERFQQYRALTAELEKTRALLEERKLVDKAKGILMHKRGMSEDEAYKAMRSLAMSSNKRLIKVNNRLCQRCSPHLRVGETTRQQLGGHYRANQLCV